MVLYVTPWHILRNGHLGLNGGHLKWAILVQYLLEVIKTPEVGSTEPPLYSMHGIQSGMACIYLNSVLWLKMFRSVWASNVTFISTGYRELHLKNDHSSAWNRAKPMQVNTILDYGHQHGSDKQECDSLSNIAKPWGDNSAHISPYRPPDHHGNASKQWRCMLELLADCRPDVYLFSFQYNHEPSYTSIYQYFWREEVGSVRCSKQFF